jgi:ATP-dependent Clp protease adaptor protein ClpS
MSTQSDTITKTKIKVQKPKQYKVVLLNDDYTPMNFVIEILMAIFGMDIISAQQLTMQIHTQNQGIAGIYTREIAVTKMNETIMTSRKYGHPLQAIVEEA